MHKIYKKEQKRHSKRSTNGRYISEKITHHNHLHIYITGACPIALKQRDSMSTANSDNPPPGDVPNDDKIDEESSSEDQLMADSHGKTNHSRYRDKSDLAVAEKVIDKRVALLLFRFRNTGFFKSIHGCVSTGKEANVYYAVGGNVYQELAIKIYKASILDYKDRRRYLEGDLRLKYWNVGKNTRRMVRKWAEKEMRNLIRLERAEINAPKPLKVRDTVVIMTFLGKDGIPFPTLKSACPPESMLHSIFLQGINILKKMYHDCRLVHGDFSEYNLLLESTELSQDNDETTGSTPILYVIDVSQAVENTGPRAFDFLKEDINNFLLYLSRRGMNLPPLKTIFSLITDDSIDPIRCQDILVQLLDRIDNAPDSDSVETYHNDYVFRNTYIDRTLHDVVNYEEDIFAAINGTPNDMPYAEATGILETFLNKLSLEDAVHSTDDESGSGDSLSDLHDDHQDDEDDDDDDDDDDLDEVKPHKSKESAEERRERRKENKLAVKEANREKRKHKVPKKVKRLLLKKSKEKR